MIRSPVLAQRLATVFDADVPRAAYEVRLGADGHSLEWIERTPSGEKRYDVEPGTSVLRRMGVEVISIFPIEWLL